MYVLTRRTAPGKYKAVDGKFQYGALAHAKKRARKINGGVLHWRKQDNGMYIGVDKNGVDKFVATKESSRRKKNPKDSARVFHDNDKLKTVYSVEFWGDEWVIFTNTDYGSRILSRYGAGDAGRNKATKHLAQIKANKKARKKNPEAEIRELIMFAENSPSLHNQLVSIMLNLSRKHKRGVYDPVLAAKLWKYWIDEAVKQYNKEILGGGYSLKQSVFTMDDRREAAIEMEDQQRDEVQTLEYLENPSHRKKKRRKKKARKKNPKWRTHYNIFKCKGNEVYFLRGFSYEGTRKAGGNPRWSLTRGDAAKYRYEHEAKSVATWAFVRGWQIGVVEKGTRITEIIAACKRGKGKRRRNPVGPTQREIDSAHELFRDFTGEHPERLQNVKIRTPKSGLVIGELDGVLYTTVRDGKTEKYQHDFKKGSRPLLASSHDGESLHILGGEYEFTERGIEDK